MTTTPIGWRQSTGQPKENNLNILRFSAASLVIFAHAYNLRPDLNLRDPLYVLTGRTMGWAAVSVFFTISGYLILLSLKRTPSLVQFARARFLRIFPGLAACIAITVAQRSALSRGRT
jgi:peptidoglycan/LPS O-acetylase OafA/YrhL